MIELRRHFRLLGLLPGAGHRRPDLTDDPSVRFWTVYSYLVAFLPREQPPFIACVLHAARSPEDLRGELRKLQDPPDH